MTDTTEAALDNLSREERRFPPTEEFAAQANVKADAYAEAAADRPAFWAKQAERLTWSKKWDQVLDWSNPPFAKWFVGGELNVAYNCLDRHVEAGLGDRVAYYFEGEPGDTRTITYKQLTDMVCQAANTLEELGVKTGDRVAIYMPMIPETIVAMLACARIGAPHTVVFGGFSADALGTRIDDCQAKIVITADGGLPPGRRFRSQARRRPALSTRPEVETVLVVKRTGQDVEWTDGRDQLVARHGREGEHVAHRAIVRLRASALRDVHVGHDRQAEGHPAHLGRLPARLLVHPVGGLRPEARDGHLLDGRRHRLGDRPQLHRLRSALERDHLRHVRGHARHPAQGPLVGDHRQVQGHHPVLRADDHPHVHEVGQRDPGGVRPVEPQAHRLGR